MFGYLFVRVTAYINGSIAYTANCADGPFSEYAQPCVAHGRPGNR